MSFVRAFGQLSSGENSSSRAPIEHQAQTSGCRRESRNIATGLRAAAESWYSQHRPGVGAIRRLTSCKGAPIYFY